MTKRVRLDKMKTAIAKAIGEDIEENGDVMPEDLLALYSFQAGIVMAMLDQRRFTPGSATNIVRANVEAGNKEALRQVQQAKMGYKN